MSEEVFDDILICISVSPRGDIETTIVLHLLLEDEDEKFICHREARRGTTVDKRFEDEGCAWSRRLQVVLVLTTSGSQAGGQPESETEIVEILTAIRKLGLGLHGFRD